ncbi:MAG: hypothetical protein PHF76_12220 [Bacteroidales bacterium]|nr:hypothetical protein [Bacteroidales bacterium]
MIRIKHININNPVTGELQEQLCGSVGFAREKFEAEITEVKAMLADRYPGMEVEIIMVNENTEGK